MNGFGGERVHLDDLGGEGRMILKWINVIRCEGLEWIDLALVKNN
jgi:hypothetical protein